MELPELVSQIPGFQHFSPREKIKVFAWHLHTNVKRDVFDNAAIRRCFEELHLVDPSVSKYLLRMADYREVMKVKGGYKLERAVRIDLDKRYGVHHSVAAVSKILKELPAKIPNVNERAFLVEALKCYRSEAFRASIVMTWNLAYAHLLDWILKDPTRLDAFNKAISKRFPKKVGIAISSYDSFIDDIKESEVIAICSTASLFNSNILKILKEKLDRRNIVAHPSSVVVVQSQADDTITDLVNNVILALI